MVTGWQARLRQLGVGARLWWSIRPGRIARHVAALSGRPGGTLRRINPAAVRLAAVQLRFTPVATPEEFAELVSPPARRAVAEGAQLIAFPADIALPLLGLLPQGKDVLAATDLQAAINHASRELGYNLTPVELLQWAGPVVRRAYLAVFRALARSLGVYIHAGTAMLPAADGTVHNTAHLFAPDGRLLARSDKAHLLPMEVDLGLTPGSDLTVADTLLGRVGMPVCMDATYWEAFRILYLKGADIVVLPTANPEPYDRRRVMRGLWSRLQESPLFGVQSCLVGHVLGLTMTGKSGVFGPAALSPGGDGVWAQVSNPDGDGVAVAAVDLTRLHAYRETIGLESSFNPELYARYFPNIYQRVARRIRQRGDQQQAGESGKKSVGSRNGLNPTHTRRGGRRRRQNQIDFKSVGAP